MRRTALALVFATAAGAAVADDLPARLLVVTAKSQPACDSYSVYPAGAKPGGKVNAAVLSKKFDTPGRFPVDGAFDVYVKPVGGVDVRVAAGLKAEAGKTHTVKLVEKLGVIDVFRRDDSPRVGKIVATDPFDAGPDEKGHVPVQTAADFRVEMLVPEGDYAVWVVPENGARAIRVADRVRVLAGRIVRVD